MIRRTALGLAICLAICLAAACSPASTAGPTAASPTRTLTPEPTASPAISAEWTEYHRDASRSGAGPAEPAITTPAVAWNAAVDADVYASPLIVSGHVIVATENNTVYSLDLFTGSVVWKKSLGAPVDASSLPCGDIRPVSGITATPAADLAGDRVYVAAYARSHRHQLFALSLIDGSVAWQQDIDPPGSNPSVQQLRGALSIGSGHVYVPFGGLYGDCGAYHGFVVAVPLGGGPALTYRVPSASGASIWSAQGATIGADGSVYVVTGNATSGGGFGYSNSVIQLSPDLHQVRSYFAPANWASLNATDTDLGSVGASLLPNGTVVAIGKQGVAYLLRAGKLGGIGGQIVARGVCNGSWGGTAWSGDLLYVPCLNGLYALHVTASSIAVVWHAAHPSLGSPIVSAGAVWAIEPGSGVLYAFEPSSGRTLYTHRLGGAAMHFTTPAATDGFVVTPVGRSVVAVSVVG